MVIFANALDQLGAPCGQRALEEEVLLRSDSVERDKRGRSLGEELGAGVDALQARLQIAELQNPPVAPRDDLTVEDQIAIGLGERGGHLRKSSRNLAERSREEPHGVADLMGLNANAVVLVLDDPTPIAKLSVRRVERDR